MVYKAIVIEDFDFFIVTSKSRGPYPSLKSGGPGPS